MHTHAHTLPPPLSLYLLQLFLEVWGDTVVSGKEDGEILRLFQRKGIHIASVQDALCSVGRERHTQESKAITTF